MEKKIIAIACILVLMLSILSACTKKVYTKKIGNEEYPVVTDENGELVTSDNGRLALYVTDEDGKYVTDENKEPMINYYEVQTDVIFNEDNVVVNGFKVNVEKGWTTNSTTGRIYKDNTDKKCYMEVVRAHVETTESSDPDEIASFNAYVDMIVAQNQQLFDKINNGEADDDRFSKAQISKKKLDRTPEGITNSAVIQYIIYDKDGNVVHYAENIYLEAEDEVIYELVYVNADGVGYDPDFNFENWSSENIIKVS